MEASRVSFFLFRPILTFRFALNTVANQIYRPDVNEQDADKLT